MREAYLEQMPRQVAFLEHDEREGKQKEEK
jgi:hypothetical protein